MVRRMGEFEVYQRTKDGYFSATKLLKQWNQANGSDKRLESFFENKSTTEFISVLSEDLNSKNSCELKTHEAKRGKTNGGTWMHPFLFIDFAMWINPKFKLQVIKFVHDQLIDFRHDAGDNYRELASAVQRFDAINYPNMARALNYIIFNTHKPELRQSATESELDELRTIQKNLAFACNTGLINSFGELLEHMRRMWANKWNGGI